MTLNEAVEVLLTECGYGEGAVLDEVLGFVTGFLGIEEELIDHLEEIIAENRAVTERIREEK
jgi:hypothetical protein